MIVQDKLREIFKVLGDAAFFGQSQDGLFYRVFSYEVRRDSKKTNMPESDKEQGNYGSSAKVTIDKVNPMHGESKQGGHI